MAKQGGSGQAAIGTWLDPLNLTGNRKNPQEEEAFKLGKSQLASLNASVGDYSNWLDPLAKNAMAMSTPGSSQENDLWKLMSSRFMDALTPKYSGAGVLTSGPGLNAMNQGLQDLSTKFADDRIQRYLQTLFGLGSLKAAPMGAYSGAISPLFSSAGTGEIKGGSLGIGNLFNVGGNKS